MDPGQFDDAEADSRIQIKNVVPDQSISYASIDQNLAHLDISSTEEDDDMPLSDSDDDDHYDLDDNYLNDEDWGYSQGDFTKQYNRLKQHIQASTSRPGARSATARSSANPAANADTSEAVVPIPASNRPRMADHAHNKYADQLAKFSGQYEQRLSTADFLASLPGAAVNPKFGQNVTKDKANRATVEQVLDPRTKLILFKMLNRGLLARIDGCVSTGKEVCPDSLWIWSVYLIRCKGECLSFDLSRA